TWIDVNPSSAGGPQPATADASRPAASSPKRRMPQVYRTARPASTIRRRVVLSAPAAGARDVAGSNGLVGRRPADELVHAAVDADGGMLARAVVDEARRPDQAGRRCDRHDVPRPALEHRRKKGARRPEERQRVDVERAEDVVVARLEQRPAGDDAGVVDEDVD